MERLNKKGQGLSLTTIILIVLGLAILVFLIFGFTRGWGNLWDTITQAGGGDANVDDVRTGCEVACAGNSIDAYCSQSRTVRFGDGTWEKGSCEAFEDSNKVSGIRCDINCDGTIVPDLESSEDEETTNNKKCGELSPAGRWVVDAAACIPPKKSRNIEVGDDSDKGTNTICCSD